MERNKKKKNMSIFKALLACKLLITKSDKESYGIGCGWFEVWGKIKRNSQDGIQIEWNKYESISHDKKLCRYVREDRIPYQFWPHAIPITIPVGIEDASDFNEWMKWKRMRNREKDSRAIGKKPKSNKINIPYLKKMDMITY